MKCITHSYMQQCRTLDKTISNLEMELAAARAAQDSLLSGSPISEDLKIPELTRKRKYLMVVGINTAFSSRKRRDSVRATWMLQGAPFSYFLIYLSCVCHIGLEKLFIVLNFCSFGESGGNRKKLEEEKGIVIRFVIGHR